MQVIPEEMFCTSRHVFGSVDYAPPWTVLAIGGNIYRVVVVVRCPLKKVFAKAVMAHREYGDWNKFCREDMV